jgi:hypothetical protein
VVGVQGKGFGVALAPGATAAALETARAFWKNTMSQPLAATRRWTSPISLVLALSLVAAAALPSAGCSRGRDRATGIRSNPERVLGVNYNPEKLETDRRFHKRALFYFVNRIFDFFDIFTINAGIGPAAHAEVHLTNGGRFGVGGAYLASFGLSEAPREWGFFGRGVGELAVGPIQGGVVHYEQYLASGEDYDEAYGSLVEEPFSLDVRAPSDQLFRKKRDYWSVGFSLGVLMVGGQFEMHPVQFFDWMAGWVLCDPLQDDK